jgi:hypothetical protein
VPETSSVISIMSKSFLNPVFVISLRSSSVLIFEIISFNEKQDVKQIDVHAERLDKCAIVDAIHILLVKINECIYHFFFRRLYVTVHLYNQELCIITEFFRNYV